MQEFMELYTDGASRGNPGKGGYGIVLKYKKHRKEFSKGFLKTTNNRMELLAVIEGLQLITNKNLNILVYSDSKYVVDAFEKDWISGWKARNFKNVKNLDLWTSLLELLKELHVKFVWVKGHGANVENNCCDKLATNVADLGPWSIDEGFLET